MRVENKSSPSDTNDLGDVGTDQNPTTLHSVKKRPHSQLVANGEKRPRALVPDTEGEVTIEVTGDIRPPSQISVISHC